MHEEMDRILIVIQRSTLEQAWDSTKGSRQREKETFARSHPASCI